SFAPAVFQSRVTKNEIEKMFPGELEDLERQRTERLAVNMEKLGPMGLKELMVIYAKDGLLDKAREAGERLLKTGRDSMTLNNMGNILFLKGDMEGSAKYYDEAARLSPQDAGIWINLARSYIRKGHKDKAKEALSRALALDAGVKDKYFDVYSEVER
ncbi:MAG: tetratricopeptide repeat protein, partial [Deltaproteobacteria bacterium]